MGTCALLPTSNDTIDIYTCYTSAAHIVLFQLFETCRSTQRISSVRARSRKLLGGNPRLQSPLPARLQHTLRLLDGKRAAVAKHIAKLRQPALADMWQHLLLDHLNVTFCSASLSSELCRHHVRSKKRGHNFEWLLRRQLFMQSQNL